MTCIFCEAIQTTSRRLGGRTTYFEFLFYSIGIVCIDFSLQMESSAIIPRLNNNSWQKTNGNSNFLYLGYGLNTVWFWNGIWGFSELFIYAKIHTECLHPPLVQSNQEPHWRHICLYNRIQEEKVRYILKVNITAYVIVTRGWQSRTDLFVCLYVRVSLKWYSKICFLMLKYLFQIDVGIVVSALVWVNCTWVVSN